MRFALLILLTAVLTAQASVACPIHSGNGLSSKMMIEPIPAAGNQKLLVILADFSDVPGVSSQASFHTQFLGGPGSGSFAEYFSEVSYGALNYTGGVVGIQGGQPVSGSSQAVFVRLPQPKSYYANGTSGTEGAFPQNLAGIYYHAVQALLAAGFDFSPYADSTTGELVNVVLVFAGRSSVESGSRSDIQPTAYSLSVFLAGGYQAQGFTFKNFTLCPEREAGGQAPIGVCVHEHGHSLGLADLYDFSYTTSGVGYFDLMAYGLYGGQNGARPFHPSAFSKVRLGWLATAATSAGLVALPPVERSGTVLKLAPAPGAAEYFLVENRQREGFDNLFSERSLCPGVYIWHVDENVHSQFYEANLVNTLPGSGGPPHPALALVEGDGGGDLRSSPVQYGECNDAFSVGQSWNDSTPGNARLWDGSPSGLSLYVQAQAEDGTVTLAIGAAAPPAATATPTVPPSSEPGQLQGKISLKAKGSTIAGKLVLSAERGGHTVSLLNKKNRRQIATAVTAANGSFRFRKVRPGSYVVKIANLSAKVAVRKR